MTAPKIYFANRTEFPKDSWKIVAERILSVDERRRADSYVREDLSLDFAFSRLVLRRVLANHLQVRPNEIRFGKGRYGKPFLERPKVRLTFNLSHCANVVVVAINEQGNGIGIDVESEDSLNGSANDLWNLSRAFSSREITNISRLDTRSKREAVIRSWTLKEAYAKALGAGLNLPLKSAEFYMDEELVFSAALKNSPLNAAHFSFAHLSPETGLWVSAAICGSHEGIIFYRIGSEFLFGSETGQDTCVCKYYRCVIDM